MKRNKQNNREARLAAKRRAREQRAKHPGGSSRYARKRAWLAKHGLWGFDVREPKPWKGVQK